MALSRALKNVMRSSNPAKKGDITKGPAIKTKPSKQFNFPKDLNAVGPHYDQDNDSPSSDALNFKMGK
ncbi:MAG: hypothetical protein KGJ90_06760 [Patescibacteria group bacterium]|nr:hypothetical protein [Patescibacteria group bacterium]